MPDLPTDMFEEEEPLYTPVRHTMQFQAYGEVEPWDDDVLSEESYPGYDDAVDDRPRRRQGRALVGDDGPDKRSRRPRRRGDEVGTERDRHRRRSRRVVQDEEYGDSRPRRRDRGGGLDDEFFASSPSVDHQGDAPELVAPRGRDRYSGPADHAPLRDRVLEQPRMQAGAATADIVTNVRPSSNPSAVRRKVRTPRNPAWQWKPIVMPQPRQMLEQAAPSLLMALSLLGTLGILGFMPGGLPLWAPLILLPTILLLFRADPGVHPMWVRSAIINLIVVGAFSPMMIVRQSFLRVPFVEFGNGTLVMPILSTIVVVGAMVVIALASAFLSQDDPEYAGMLFLPAALLVPFFAGATEITGLGTALMIIGVIYVACAFLTVIASMLPGAFPTLVAPIALALEFFVLPVSESTPIFPVGAGMSAKLLFFVVLAMGVGLTVAVPMLAVWVRQVRRIVGTSMKRRSSTPATA